MVELRVCGYYTHCTTQQLDVCFHGIEVLLKCHRQRLGALVLNPLAVLRMKHTQVFIVKSLAGTSSESLVRKEEQHGCWTRMAHTPPILLFFHLGFYCFPFFTCVCYRLFFSTKGVSFEILITNYNNIYILIDHCEIFPH